MIGFVGFTHLAMWHASESLDILMHDSGRIIATSNDRKPQNGGLVWEIPLFQGNLGW